MLNRRYRLTRTLAKGGMAEILLADYEGDDGLVRQVVVKRILADFSKDPAFVTMFMGEAKLAAKFIHPNIVRVIDFGIDEGRYFLSMEYVDGFNLRTLSKRAEALGRPVPYELAARIIAQACEGLGYAHAFSEDGLPLRLIHRDISPENLLIGRNGIVKVADFGIAKVEGQVRTTRTGMVKGKLAYMAPEQFTGGPVDHRVDIFALGIVLFELCSGRRPFDGVNDGQAMQAVIDGRPTPLSTFRPDAPAALQEIVDRAMANLPGDRYQNCSAMQIALERFSSRTSAQALAVFVADIAPSETVTEAKTSVVCPPAVVAPVPEVAPSPSEAFNPNASRTLILEPAAAAPRVPAPRRHAPDPVAAEPVVRRPEPSGEFPDVSAFRRKTPRWLIPAGVALLIGVAFALGRMGGDPTPVVAVTPSAEPKPVDAPKQAAEPKLEPRPPPPVKEARVEPEPLPRKTSTKPGKPSVEPARRAEVHERPPAPQQPASSPSEWEPAPKAAATPTRGIVGRVTHDAARGYVIANDSDSAWHRCEVRLPDGKFFAFHDTTLNPHQRYNIQNAALLPDHLESDAYIIGGYAQLRCDEGSKYILVAN